MGWHNEVHQEWIDEWLANRHKRQIEAGIVCAGCGEYTEYCCCEACGHGTIKGSVEEEDV